MRIIAQNLPLRRLPVEAWTKIETDLRRPVGHAEGVELISLVPGVMELDLTGPSRHAVEGRLRSLKAGLPDWRFSESRSYSLPEPVNLQVLG